LGLSSVWTCNECDFDFTLSTVEGHVRRPDADSGVLVVVLGGVEKALTAALLAEEDRDWVLLVGVKERGGLR